MKKLILLTLITLIFICSSCVSQQYIETGDYVGSTKYKDIYINYYRNVTILSTEKMSEPMKEYMYHLNGQNLYSVEDPDTIPTIKKFK